MTVSPLRILLLLTCSLIMSKSTLADWPRILVLPPVAETEMDQKLKDDFQWNLVDHITKCRVFECVTQREYESYLKEHNMAGISTIPDSVRKKMMKDLYIDLFAQPTLNQPGGEGTEFSAQVTYNYPADHYTRDDYLFKSEWYSGENEQKSWYLAAEYIHVIFQSRKLITAMIKARAMYNSMYIGNNIGRQMGRKPLRRLMDSVRKDYQKLVEMEPDNRTFNFMLGMCLFNARRYDKAITQFNHVLANIDPVHVHTHERLADHYYYTVKDYESALRHFSKLAEIDPQRYTYTHHWALTLTRLERQEEAIEIYEKLIEIEDNDTVVRHLLAEHYYNTARVSDKEQGDLLKQKASDYMVRACEISRIQVNAADSSQIYEHCQKLNFLSLLKNELNETEAYLETLRELVYFNPSFPGACFNLAIYAHKARDFEKAIDYYGKAVICAEDDEKAAIYFQIGIINLQNFKDYPQAIAALTSALETNDIYMKEMAHYFRATAYLEYARELDYASDEVADIDALIGSGTMNQARVDRALSIYVKSMDDLREISTTDPKMVRSTQLHTKKIIAMQERLARIQRQIDYNRKNK
jgi:tetratricopeptide (TPR) repeat protein